jgi:prepilin-type N-terminal cleavage/methylation domain-containing protein
MKRGFSLFEIMLVLFVLSMIVMGGIQYSQSQQEKNAAQQLGQRLYQYGVAVSEYARLNPDKLLPGDHEMYGIEWLKNKINPETCDTPDLTDPDTCDTFLGQDFNLQLKNLYIAGMQGDEDAQDDQLYTEFEQINGELRIKLVELGTVYRYAKAKESTEEQTVEYVVDLSLPGQAAMVANEHTYEYGSARLTYTVEKINAGNDIDDIHVVGIPTTSLPNVDSGYLRTDGSNKMDGDLAFSSPATGKGLVLENGEKINRWVLEGVKDPKFNPGDKTRGQPGDSDLANTTWGDFYISRKNDGGKWVPLVANGRAYNTKNSFCFLTGFEEIGEGGACRVVPVGEKSTNHQDVQIGDCIMYIWKRGDTGTSTCFARCLLFKQ